MVALFLRQEDKELFFCGSVLISASRILTAAHCLWPKNRDSPEIARDVIVKLGAHELNNTREVNVYAMPVAEIIIHPDWNPHIKRFDADLAILVLENEVQFTDYMKPICIADESFVRAADEGIAVGWGQSEDKSRAHENLPREAKLPIPSNEVCLLEHGELTKIASTRTFCAGAKGVKSVCKGLWILIA